MPARRLLLLVVLVSVALSALPRAQSQATTAAGATKWEEAFRALPQAANIKEYDRRLSARPHHVGSPYDKDNAEWLLAQFKEWGWDATIERFDVLFPTPKERVLEMVAPTKFLAKLEEPAVAVDPTSGQKAEQLPTYNAYSIGRRRHRAARLRELRRARRLRGARAPRRLGEGRHRRSPATARPGAASSRRWRPSTARSAA